MILVLVPQVPLSIEPSLSWWLPFSNLESGRSNQIELGGAKRVKGRLTPLPIDSFSYPTFDLLLLSEVRVEPILLQLELPESLAVLRVLMLSFGNFVDLLLV